MRLIDADALHFDNIWKKYGRLNDSVVACEILVEEAPTIDAVEVVRCKDCKYAEEEKTEHPYGVLCNHATVGGYGDVFDFMHYCSYGERKDED